MEPALGLLILLSLDIKSQVRQIIHKKNTYPKSSREVKQKRLFFSLFSFCCGSQGQYQYCISPRFFSLIYICRYKSAKPLQSCYLFLQHLKLENMDFCSREHLNTLGSKVGLRANLHYSNIFLGN